MGVAHWDKPSHYWECMDPAHPSFGMAMAKILRPVLAWHWSSCTSDVIDTWGNMVYALISCLRKITVQTYPLQKIKPRQKSWKVWISLGNRSAISFPFPIRSDLTHYVMLSLNLMKHNLEAWYSTIVNTVVTNGKDLDLLWVDYKD